MQTILGSGGAIGYELAKDLPKYTESIRLVSRNPRKVNPDDELVSADLTDEKQTMNAVAGSDVAYLTAGIQYKTTAWQEQWPVIMTNVIRACEKHSTKLVFFDNVYLYGKVAGWMTEETPVRPVSKKGEVRARIAEQLMNEVKDGNIQALIARSADFYGSRAKTSIAIPMIFQRLKDGKKAQWLVNDKVRHSFTYTPDAGKATALLGNTEEAYGQVWHLPTDRNALTGEEFIREVAKAYDVEPRHSVFSPFIIKLGGLFDPMAKESVEMLYQLESDYLFDSSKFEKQFFSPTPYKKGIEEIRKELG